MREWCCVCGRCFLEGCSGGAGDLDLCVVLGFGMNGGVVVGWTCGFPVLGDDGVDNSVGKFGWLCTDCKEEGGVLNC